MKDGSLIVEYIPNSFCTSPLSSQFALSLSVLLRYYIHVVFAVKNLQCYKRFDSLI